MNVNLKLLSADNFIPAVELTLKLVYYFFNSLKLKYCIKKG